MVGSAIRSAVLALALVLVLALPAQADYAAGQRAWDAGRFTEAVSEWKAAADAGDGRAMLALGRAFVKGVGVPQDYVEAHKWLNLAAGRGDAQAAAERATLAEKMTVEEQAEARKLARAWRPGDGAGADTGEAAAAPAAPAAEDPGPPPVEALREAQALLAALGYDPGPADGIWGRRSVQAYQSFLRDAGQPPAEVLTPQALHAMRAIAERQGSAPAVAASDEVPPATAAAAPSRPALPPDALHRAAKAGNVKGLKAALEAGADVNALDERGWTALMHLANKGYTLLMPPLLEAQADPDIRAPDGATALFIAAVHGHSEVIVHLMKAEADISIRGPKGKTAVDAVLTRYGDLTLLSFRDCNECPEMVVVPAGSFTMGSPELEEDWGGAEGQQHRVTIPEPFAVGKYEVTFAEWDACTAAGGCNGYRPHSESWDRPGWDPVHNVSWQDAKAYVAWLSRKTGERYRLLSEAEWEYAARAGTTGPFHFGSTISSDQANYRFTYGSGRKGVYRGKALRVGSLPANGFGLHDVHGNVSEWVEDCWHKDYVGAPANGSAWVSGGDCEWRVLRGGSWSDRPGDLRSANRDWSSTESRNSGSGFRIARTLTP